VLAQVSPAAEISADELVDEDLMDEFAFLEDAGVVEAAARHKQEIGMSPSAITVITREDIEATGASDIANILRMVPGMDVVLSTAVNISISARLEWNDENQYFLVLIDGREVNLEALGQAPLVAQPISLDDIERIEIIRGPGSSLYGANALAGVVSITTRAISEETSGWAYFAGGEVGSIIAGARASTRIGSWGLSISGGADISGTFADPNQMGREVVKLRAIAEYRWSETQRILIDAGFSKADGSISLSLGTVDMESEIRTLRMAYESENIRGNLYWAQVPISAQLTAPFDFAGIRLATFLPMDVDSHSVNGDVQWTLPQFYEPLVMIAGAMGRTTWISSDQLLDAETYADITSSRYHQPGIDHWEIRGGAFVHLEYSPFDWVTIFGDLRFDYNSVTGEFLSNPGIPQAFLHGNPYPPERGVPRRKPHHWRRPGELQGVHGPGARQQPPGQRGAGVLRGGLPGAVSGQTAQREPGSLLQLLQQPGRHQ